MKTLSNSMLAVTGLALSLAACGPGIKGEGTKKPNLQRQVRAEAKLLKAEAEKNPTIKSIALGESDEDEILVTVELARADDVEKKSIDGLVTIDGAIASVDAVKGRVVDGKANIYKISLACLEECAMIAGILDTEFGVPQPTDETAKDKELFSAQSGTTAPEAKASVASNLVRTGVIVSATGEVLHKEPLDPAATIEENLEVLKGMINLKMKPLGMIQ